jgi:GntR family transcriptional regulator
MTPPFQLSQADSRPMYLQIMDSIKQLILKGEWVAGQALPSIRELAVSVKVSVITVKRAYQELERENVIVTRHGLGSFVAEQNQVVMNLKKAELMACVDRVIKLAVLLNIDQTELLEMIAARIEEGGNDD